MTNGSSQGLLIVVAVVIFGIFVFISYLLFKDTLKPSLAKIYCDSITQVADKTGLVGNGFKCGTEDSDEKDKEGLGIYRTEALDTGVTNYFAKIRHENTENGETAIYLKIASYPDSPTIKVLQSSAIKDEFSNTSSSTIKGGSLDLDSLTELNISDLTSNSFSQATFTGNFKSNTVTNIDPSALKASIFKGTFSAKNVLSVRKDAFLNAKFTGEFDAPKIEFVYENAFNRSRFTGEFKSTNLQGAFGACFYNSNFSGDLIAPNLLRGGSGAFGNSSFSRVDLGEATLRTAIGDVASITSSNINVKEYHKEFAKMSDGSFYNG